MPLHLARELQGCNFRRFLPQPVPLRAGRRQEGELPRNLPKESLERRGLRPQARAGATESPCFSVRRRGP